MKRKTQCLDGFTEAEQLAAVRRDWDKIRYITNPSEAVQMAAVEQNWVAIVAHIRNPSEAAQVAAVGRNKYAIRYIINPSSEAVQLTAVRQDESAIRWIKNPSEAVLATHLLHHPRSPLTPKAVLDRAEAILNAHCPGLGDVYMVGLSIDMSEEDLKTALAAHIKEK